MLRDIKKHVKEDIMFYESNIAGYLESADMNDMEKRRQITEKVKDAKISDTQRELFSRELGSQFADCLVGAGYRVEESPMMFKQMIMIAFPVVNKEQNLPLRMSSRYF